ncbi:hypothetical protein D3C85_1874540 [compost metagenome]
MKNIDAACRTGSKETHPLIFFLKLRWKEAKCTNGRMGMTTIITKYRGSVDDTKYDNYHDSNE